jgi:transcriptional regulator with XRE-family HTH domain
MSEINYSYNSNKGNNNTGLGSTLRALRDQHNISQVDLCKGIMSTTKLSRIETGKDLPSDLELSLLMDRLHEPGYLLSDYYATQSAEERHCQLLLRDACYFDRWERAEELLWAFENLLPKSSVPSLQYARLVELVCQRNLGGNIPPKEWVDYCIKLLHMTCPDYQPSIDVTELHLTQQEVLLLNAIAVGLLEWNMIRQARILLLQLLSFNRSRKDSSDTCAITRIVLEHNLLLCEMKGPFHGRSLQVCQSLLSHCSTAGGTYLYCKVLRTRQALLLSLGQENAAYENEQCLAFLYRQLPLHLKIPFVEFKAMPLEMLML